MINVIFRPIDKWPGKPKSARRSASFKATYAKTLDLLERELNAIGATGIIIQARYTLDQIRNDGWPRSSQKPSGPEVILTFQRRKQTYSFPCDTFWSWQDNLRAIALSLEALRMVDRFGVTQNNEQYQGFAALEAPKNTLSRKEAVEFLASVTGRTWTEVSADPKAAYIAAARIAHPDTGGDHEMFVYVSRAAQALGV